MAPLPIEDYAIIGDTHAAALVGRNGSIDWLCLPRFDSGAVFAQLLGDESHGFWRIAPATDAYQVSRRYRPDTLVLETDFETADGAVQVIDCMPIREDNPQVVRVVKALRGRVDMKMELVIRFGYGSVMPWVHRVDGMLAGIAGPDAVALWTPIHTEGRDFHTVAEFTVGADEHVPFVLVWYPSHWQCPPRPIDARYAVTDTETWWREWVSRCTYQGEWRDQVVRSLITLKALTYNPTGGIVAAATTSLPESLGGERNWDYRYCWLRDATLTLESLMRGGYHGEAMDWRNWLVRAVAGDVSQLQIMYGPGGERRLDEWTADWLPGYEGSTPVRIGNAASQQFQLDVYGEVLSALYEACTVGSTLSQSAWDLQMAMAEFVERTWTEPDEGIWEVRGPRRHFTHSKVMAWLALDSVIRTVEEFGQEGPVDRWRAVRAHIHDEVLAKGYDENLGAFTQYFGSRSLDASLLMMPLVGFLPATDPRVRSTIEAIERDLTEDGFVLRYRSEDSSDVDGLHGKEGAFLACSFWMADCMYLLGREEDARRLFERLLALCNDVGLLSEEYDVAAGRQVGNFPQAFSHVSLANAAFNLSGHLGLDMEEDPKEERRRRHATAVLQAKWITTTRSRGPRAHLSARSRLVRRRG